MAEAAPVTPPGAAAAAGAGAPEAVDKRAPGGGFGAARLPLGISVPPPTTT
jgi:hypothetical protein